jgi:hypothetical protein
MGRANNPSRRGIVVQPRREHEKPSASAASQEAYRKRLRENVERDREVLAGGVNVLVHDAPDWAKTPSVWTRVDGPKVVYVQAHESRAVSVYYARYGENPYSVVDGFTQGDEVITSETSLVHASAHDRNVRLVMPRGGSYEQALVDETRANNEADPTLSLSTSLHGAFDVVRAEEIVESDLVTSGEELRSLADGEWQEDLYAEFDDDFSD